MRILNRGKKSIHIGGGKKIPPNGFFDCDEESGKKILKYCSFCCEVPQESIADNNKIEDANNGQGPDTHKSKTTP